jgi:hypothetical protein
MEAWIRSSIETEKRNRQPGGCGYDTHLWRYDATLL